MTFVNFRPISKITLGTKGGKALATSLLLSLWVSSSPLLAQTTWDGGASSTILAASGQALPLSLYSYASGADILGGERDMQFDLVASNPLVTGASSGNAIYVGNDPFFYGGNYLDTARSSGVAGTATFVWDGVDGSSAINYTGLGGVNLADAYNGIQFNIVRDSNVGSWEFRFYSDQDHVSGYTVSFPGQSIDLPGTHYESLFTSMTSLGSLGGADFSSIGAIVVLGSSPVPLDSFVVNYGFISVPEPATLLMGILTCAGLIVRRRR